MDNGVLKTECAVKMEETLIASAAIETCWRNRDDCLEYTVTIGPDASNSVVATFREPWNGRFYARRNMLGRHHALLPLPTLIVNSAERLSIEIKSDLDTRTPSGAAYYHYLLTSQWTHTPYSLASGFREHQYVIHVDDVSRDSPYFEAERGYWHGMENEENAAKLLLDRHWPWLMRLFG